MGTRENKVEKYLHDQVTKIGGTTRKWLSYTAGVPDRIVIFQSVVWFVEVKTESGKLSEPQVREQARLRREGANVTTVEGVQGVDEFISINITPLGHRMSNLSKCCKAPVISMTSLSKEICSECYTRQELEIDN